MTSLFNDMMSSFIYFMLAKLCLLAGFVRVGRTPTNLDQSGLFVRVNHAVVGILPRKESVV